jgi:hypothetical protein
MKNKTSFLMFTKIMYLCHKNRFFKNYLRVCNVYLFESEFSHTLCDFRMVLEN